MPSRENERHVEAARRALVLAQHALLTPTREGIAEAILHGCLAVLEMARADPEQKSLSLLVASLRARDPGAFPGYPRGEEGKAEPLFSREHPAPREESPRERSETPDSIETAPERA